VWRLKDVNLLVLYVGLMIEKRSSLLNIMYDLEIQNARFVVLYITPRLT
jgi:hypothetical protein